MQVVVNTIEEFVSELRREAGNILENTVRVTRTHKWLQQEQVSAQVGFQAAAVVRLTDGSEYLLECGMDCGRDYSEDDGENEGTKRYEWLLAELDAALAELELERRPGAISV